MNMTDEQMTIDDVQDEAQRLIELLKQDEDDSEELYVKIDNFRDRVSSYFAEILGEVQTAKNDIRDRRVALERINDNLSKLRDRMGDAGEADGDGDDDDMPRITIDDKNPNIIASIIEESDKSITFTVANVGRRAATVGDITVRSHIFQRYSPVTKYGKMSRSGFKLKDADVDLDVAIVRDLRIGAGVTDTIRLEVA